MDLEKEFKECEKIKNPIKQNTCKINVLAKEVGKLEKEQKPVQWWLEVIAKGTKPMFDDLKEGQKRIEDKIDTISTKLDWYKTE